jgi:hypothetical protein
MRSLALAVLAASLFAASGVFAAPFPVADSSTSSATHVENVNDPVLHPYQEYAGTSCASPGNCVINFPKTTHSETLVTHTSCLFGLASGGVALFAYLGILDSSPKNFIPVIANGTSGTTTNYLMNSQTYVFYAKGQQPRIDVLTATAGATSLQCTVSGYYY